MFSDDIWCACMLGTIHRNLVVRYHLLIKMLTLDHVQAPAPSKGCQLKTLRDGELTSFRNHLAPFGRCWYSNVHPIHPYHQAVGRWWNETYEFFDVSRRLKKNGSVKGNHFQGWSFKIFRYSTMGFITIEKNISWENIFGSLLHFKFVSFRSPYLDVPGN